MGISNEKKNAGVKLSCSDILTERGKGRLQIGKAVKNCSVHILETLSSQSCCRGVPNNLSDPRETD